MARLAVILITLAEICRQMQQLPYEYGYILPAIAKVDEASDFRLPFNIRLIR